MHTPSCHRSKNRICVAVPMLASLSLASCQGPSISSFSYSVDASVETPHPLDIDAADESALEEARILVIEPGEAPASYGVSVQFMGQETEVSHSCTGVSAIVFLPRGDTVYWRIRRTDSEEPLYGSFEFDLSESRISDLGAWASFGEYSRGSAEFTGNAFVPRNVYSYSDSLPADHELVIGFHHRE